MSQAANIISTATQVPDIVRGVGVAGAKDLQLADSYQFSSILRHLVDSPEKTMEAARGPEKDNEPLLRPKTVELMSSTFVDEFGFGRISPGLGFGLSVQIVNEPVAAGHAEQKADQGRGRHTRPGPVERDSSILSAATAPPLQQH